MTCVTNAMKRAQASGDLAKLGRGVENVSKAAHAPNFTNWRVTPKGCSELTLAVDDKFESTVQDDGERGSRSYVLTKTVKGLKSVAQASGGTVTFEWTVSP
jgi:hypothetical protein